MTDQNFSFDSMNDVKAHTGQRVVPDSGDYNVMISEIKMESNSKNTGHNIIVTYSILDGDNAGSEIKEWLSVINTNETAQRISQSKLKALYLVTKKTNAANFTELGGTILRIRILKKENTYIDNNGNQRDGYETEVVNYMDTQGRNSEGKEVSEYTGPAVILKKGGSAKVSNNSAGSVNGNSYGQSNSNVGNSNSNDDDEIPF